MIGQVKLAYSTNDIVNLIKRDIEHKFGQRDLVGVDLGISDIYSPAALVTSYPAPQIKITSVEEQVKELQLPALPTVPRSATSVGKDSKLTGGPGLNYSFDRQHNTLNIGGTALWSNPVAGAAPRGAHWVGVFIGFPLGLNFEPGDSLAFSINGRPSFIKLPTVTTTKTVLVEEPTTELTHETPSVVNPTAFTSDGDVDGTDHLTGIDSSTGTETPEGGAATTEDTTNTETSEDSGTATEGGKITKYTQKTIEEVSLAEQGITVYLDAAYTENDIVINWSPDYEPEKLKVFIDATLEDVAVKKFPRLPKEPRVEYKFPEAKEYVQAKIKMDVDLSMGLPTSNSTFAR